MANAYEPRTDLADRLLQRTERGPKVGFGSALFRRLGIADPFAGGDITDRALTQPKLDFLSSRAYLAELRGLSRRRMMLLDRISSVRSALRSHHAFQQRIATPAVREATLGLTSSTLIDWSTQIEDGEIEGEGTEAIDDAGARALTSRRHKEQGALRETSATRALKSQIAQANGVLAQLQRLLDVDRSGSDRAMQKVADLGRQTPTERAASARKLARQLRGVAGAASRGTQLTGRASAVGERPLAVAQARQADDREESKGLRRVLGESPVIMTLEEPEAPVVDQDAPPPQRRSARPAVESAPRAARDPHAGRVARAATEARSQASVGRAGPPAESATASPANRVAAASSSSRTVRATARPTQRIAHAAIAATNAPLHDVRRGLKAVEAPRAITRRLDAGVGAKALDARHAAVAPSPEGSRRAAPAVPTMVPVAPEGADEILEDEDGSDQPIASSSPQAAPAASGRRSSAPPSSTAASTSSEPVTRRALQAAAPARVDGVARIAARSDAGSIDAAGRVTGATRYLAPQTRPSVGAAERAVVVEHGDGRYRRFDVTSDAATVRPSTLSAREGASASAHNATTGDAAETRPMALSRTAPTMTVPELQVPDAELEADDTQVPAASRPAAKPAPAARVTRSTPAASDAASDGRRSTTSGAPAQGPSAVVSPSRVTAAAARGTTLPPVARAMQRAVPTSTERAIAVSRPAVVPTRIERGATDVVRTAPMAAQRTARVAARPAPASPERAAASSASPVRGSLQATVPAGDSPRAAASEATGIRRRSRALPTVRAAARTLAQERWGARGRMLAPSVSRFVEADSFDQVVTGRVDARRAVAGRIAADESTDRGVTRTSSLAGTPGERIFATPESVDAMEDGSEADVTGSTPTQGASAPRTARVVNASASGKVPATAGSTARTPVATASERAIGPVARAAHRGSEHPRVADGRTLVAPRVVTPFETPAPRSVAERVEARAELSRDSRAVAADGAPRTDAERRIGSPAEGGVREAAERRIASAEGAPEPGAAGARRAAVAPQLVGIQAPVASEDVDETEVTPVAARPVNPGSVTAGSVERASRRGADVVPAARRTLLPQPTPEQQVSEAHRVVARTERRLEAAGEPSPFRSLRASTFDASSAFETSAKQGESAGTVGRARRTSIVAPLDPVLVRSIVDDSPPVEIADAVVRANARAERAPTAARAARRADGEQVGSAPAGTSLPSVPGLRGYSPTLPAFGAPLEDEAVAEGTAPAARSTSVESPVARAVRRSASTRTSLTASPVTSAHSFADDVASVQPRRVRALGPDTVFAEHALPDLQTEAPSGEVPSQRSPAASAAARTTPSRGARAHTGTQQAVATSRRAPATVRALGRSRSRRDLRSVVPHPVGTARTARASTRMLDRAPGAVAAPEAVLVRPEEVVDLASGPTSPQSTSLPLGRGPLARAVHADDGGIDGFVPVDQPAPFGSEAAFERLAERADRASVAPERTATSAIVDGMTLAEAWSEDLPATDESIAGGRRAVGRLPGQDRSRFAAPQAAARQPMAARERMQAGSAVVRSALQDVLQNASVLRAAERGDDPVVSVPGVRRAAGLREDRSTRFEARVRSTGSGVETVVVDTLTGETVRTRGASPALQGTLAQGVQAQGAGAQERPTPLQRVEQREGAVADVDGRPRASMRGADVSSTVLAGAQLEQQLAEGLAPSGRAPLSRTFDELLEGRVASDETRRPLLRRRTWNRRQLAHELGEFAPAMAEAEYLDAPIASDDAPAWARRAVTGTGVQRAGTERPQTRGPRARAQRDLPDGVSVEGGVARAFEPSSLIGALSRADGPDELIKVIVERRTEVQTIRETLPVEAVRLVERLASLSPEEVSVLQGSRTLQAQPRTLSGPRRGGSRGQGFTQLSGANDGHGANQVMKLADKLRNLIHLAENQRLADAHRQLQMSQAAAKAASGAFDDPRGPGQSPDAQTMNMQKLQDDVWKSLQKQFEKLKTQMGDL